MRTASRVFLVLLPAIILHPAQSSQAIGAPPQQGTQSGRETSIGNYRADFDTVLQLVRDQFYDPNLNGVDWNKVGETYRAKLADTKSKSEFQLLINRMLAELHASHAAYATDDDIEFYMLPAVLRQDMNGHRTEHIGIMGSQDRGEFVVAGVLEGGPAEKAGIQSGDRLISAEGQPFRSAGSFRGRESQPVIVQFRRGTDAGIRSTTVVPIKQNILRAFLDATEKSAKVLSVGGRRIGYIHLWTMANEAFRQALDTLVQRKLHDTDGLILDLRDGYGGSPWTYADVFFRPDVAWEQQSRGGAAITRYSGYGKPMVAVINQGTRSAKEFLSYELKTTRRATLVGTRTAGAFLGAGGFEVGSDGLLELPVVGLKVDGRLLEANGVTPNITVTPKFTYTDRDAQLLAGQQTLLDAIRSKPASDAAAKSAF